MKRFIRTFSSFSIFFLACEANRLATIHFQSWKRTIVLHRRKYMKSRAAIILGSPLALSSECHPEKCPSSILPSHMARFVTGGGSCQSCFHIPSIRPESLNEALLVLMEPSRYRDLSPPQVLYRFQLG